MNDRIVIPDRLLLQTIIQQLDAGIEVCFRPKGYSMLPFIIGGRDSVGIVKREKVEVGDIVLARLCNGVFVMHRIVEINGGRVRLMGDGNVSGTESCRVEDICGTVIWIETPNGRRTYCQSRSHRKRAALWRRIMPARRILLAIYRRTYLRYILHENS